MNCKNCENTLHNIDGFCSNCGARVIDERITFKFLFKEFLDKVFSIDNKLLKTFLHLFTKPHQVIDGYIHGVRKRYFHPFSYLLISITLAGVSLYFLKDLAIQSIESATIPNTNNSFNSKEFQETVFNYAFDYQSFVTALTIPIYGFISWIVFLNKKKYNYFEHMIIYIYTSAQISILNFVVSTPIFFIHQNTGIFVSLTISSLLIFYNAYVLIRLFKLTFIQFIIKFIYFVFISFALYILTIIIVFAGMFILMGPSFFKQFRNVPVKKDSIQKVEPIDSSKALKKDVKAISYYDAASKLNCLSYKFL